MNGVQDVGLLMWVMVWLEPDLSPYKFPNILNPIYTSYLPAYEDGTECSETMAFKLQTTVNRPEERIQDNYSY
jgi:hypothetical protein